MRRTKTEEYFDKDVKIDVSKIFNRGNEFTACMNARREIQNDDRC
jgi:hypothetical protein